MRGSSELDADAAARKELLIRRGSDRARGLYLALAAARAAAGAPTLPIRHRGAPRAASARTTEVYMYVYMYIRVVVYLYREGTPLTTSGAGDRFCFRQEHCRGHRSSFFFFFFFFCRGDAETGWRRWIVLG